MKAGKVELKANLPLDNKNKTASRNTSRSSIGKVANREANESILNWYLSEIHKIPMLDREEEYGVADQALNGDEAARNTLVQGNLRFVVTVARRYQSCGLNLMDLINEGNLGLIKAAERFNPDRGFHFISYAVWWIKQSILFAIQQKSHLIRLPLNRAVELRRKEEAERWLENKDHPENNLKALAAILKIRPEDLNHLINVSRDHLSLDAPMLDGDDFTLGECIEDHSNDRPDLSFERTDLRQDIQDSMVDLTSREKKVLALRYGLNDEPVLSLQKIGKRIGLSKERIRQIEKKAIRKIRTGTHSLQLAAYL